jgi:DNA replication protein DnaC
MIKSVLKNPKRDLRDYSFKCEDSFKNGFIPLMLNDDELLILSNYGLPQKFLKLYIGDFHLKYRKKLKQYFSNLGNNLLQGKAISFCGPVGTRKTSLMTVTIKTIFSFFKDTEFKDWINHKRIKKLGMEVIYWQSGEIMLDYFNNKDKFKKKINSEVLGIDDITKVTDDFYISVLDYVLRHRDANSLPTFITSQLPITEIGKEFSRPIQDLIQGNNLTIKMLGESSRGKK